MTSRAEVEAEEREPGNEVVSTEGDRNARVEESYLDGLVKIDSIEENLRMRNQSNKRKRSLRTAREREDKGMRTQKERDAYSRAKELARIYHSK